MFLLYAKSLDPDQKRVEADIFQKIRDFVVFQDFILKYWGGNVCNR